MKDVVAVILAGGKGKRMLSMQSKTLHKVSDRAILDWQLDACQLAGIENIVVVVGAHSDEIRQHLSRDGHALNIRIAVQEEPLGTADAVNAAMNTIRELKARYAVISRSAWMSRQLMDALSAIRTARSRASSNSRSARPKKSRSRK